MNLGTQLGLEVHAIIEKFPNWDLVLMQEPQHELQELIGFLGSCNLKHFPIGF